MKSGILWAAGVGILMGLGAPQHVVAQEAEAEDPGSRIVTVSSFKLPFQHRSTVIPWIQKYFLPGAQLNPAAITTRVLFHNWGSDAADIAFVVEYASWEDVNADCGQPCEDYEAANPVPEEGTPEREAYDEAQGLFSKYYSNHRDEIYVAPMGMSKVEGTMMGPVGGPEDDDEGDG